MKKIFIASLIIALSVLAVAPAMADDTTSTVGTPVTVAAPAKFVRRTVAVTGTIASLAGTSVPTTLVINLTKVTPKQNKKWVGTYPAVGQSFTVQIASTTRVIRDYFAKAALTELQTGDTVSVTAKTNQDGTITAQVVKDDSIHVSLRTGKVTSISGASFVLTTGKNGVTVNTDASTKFKVAKVTNATLSNLAVGDSVVVSGYINTNTKTVYITKSVRVLKKAPVGVTINTVIAQ